MSVLGAYGSSVEPYFLSTRLSLLDRGFICAIAHVRGGGEMGRQWYEEGKLLKKANTFADMIACVEHLVRKKYTSKGNVAIFGGISHSNLTRHPDIYPQIRRWCEAPDAQTTADRAETPTDMHQPEA